MVKKLAGGPGARAHPAARELLPGAHVRGRRPLTGHELRLAESTSNEAEAKRILNRFRAQVDAQQNARTKATLGAAIDAWLRVHKVEENTRQGYEAYARKYIKPALGNVSIGKVTARLLEEFYAELRRCRLRCDGRPAIDHRTDEPHDCRVGRHRWPPGRRPVGGHLPHDCAVVGCTVVDCPPHE